MDTGISLMELDCLLLILMLIRLRFVYQTVDIRRNTNANSPNGIYRCDIIIMILTSQ